MFLTNSLSKKKERFIPINPANVAMYTCGPTVYDYATIGNFRTYTTSDVLLRVLKFNGFNVTFIMNITDVGHLSGDNLGDADTGEDRIVKAAKREGKTAWDIAKFYTEAFYQDFEKLNLVKPKLFSKATNHIQEQINLVKKLEEKGYTYKINDGIYFDTKKYEEVTGKRYGELSNLDQIKEGKRVKPNSEKRNPRDFALWKLSRPSGTRHMEWESPWGIGFPGWHIECSAMSMKYLGESFDIHVGGEDLQSTHHPNEIAQSEAATDKPFVKYWIHGASLKVDGGRMGKSLGNAYTVNDIIKKGFDPLTLRYLYFTAHYRKQLNFTWDGLKAAQSTLDNLRQQTPSLNSKAQRTILSQEKSNKVDYYINGFREAVNDDLDIPQALSILWKMLKDSIPGKDRYNLLLAFDEVLGLDLSQTASVTKRTGLKFQISEKASNLLKEREKLRKVGKWKEADKIREKIAKIGYTVEDTSEGTRLKKIRVSNLKV
ncbi:cysteine--tRNA ligase [Candidatus Woesebacteria bacterium RIFCSPHIGHO2_01_FULL_38_10]|uniref:Cysteine--tRNA ligase n=1 Tax=Candidatus Woesebacteria bacterium RIFCSPLOWO2_01_FULL_39_10b TaxID=1802517 RepID=A0A1F8B8E6_9BACT|nr:MAG: cysteine--tRNA ligase [Candidatus Woesebacteria bacterium RIFCSPHIGHO2_01_FULL_38_10]OGM59618.1 MAG: cysteine--tRNA ligase [Candidatus Woesebacteria bacterium RIFCSPLOWO2_01_FULL_39_10b]